MNKKTILLKRLLPLGVLLIGAAIAWWLVSTAPEPEKAEKRPPGALVETIVVSKKTEQLHVRVQGTVVPARRVTVLPQVAGRIVSVHPSLQPGGILREGERMVAIDPSDFRLSVEQRKTELAEARAQLKLEQGRRSVAQSEWELFKEEFGDETDMPEQKPDLALREPQLAAARAQVSRAEAAVKAAQLQLERTQISAPFHALVLEESAAEGQSVSQQQSIAQLVGADRFWVRTAVPPERIPFIDIPMEEGRKGSPAEVVLDLGTEDVRFEGYVSRLEARLDEQSRMAQLIVTIPDPLGAMTGQSNGNEAKEKFPLLLNAYVDVVIQAGKPVEAFVVPRTAVRGGNQVYVYDNGRLRIREIDILWEREDAVLARGGLQEGEQLIVSNLSSPVQGMALRLPSENGEPAK